MFLVQIWAYKCQRPNCGNIWVTDNMEARSLPAERLMGQDIKPRVCPKCKSAYWDSGGAFLILVWAFKCQLKNCGHIWLPKLRKDRNLSKKEKILNKPDICPAKGCKKKNWYIGEAA